VRFLITPEAASQFLKLLAWHFSTHAYI